MLPEFTFFSMVPKAFMCPISGLLPSSPSLTAYHRGCRGDGQARSLRQFPLQDSRLWWWMRWAWKADGSPLQPRGDMVRAKCAVHTAFPKVRMPFVQTPVTREVRHSPPLSSREGYSAWLLGPCPALSRPLPGTVPEEACPHLLISQMAFLWWGSFFN